MAPRGLLAAALLAASLPASGGEVVGERKRPLPCDPPFDARPLLRIEREEGEITRCQKDILFMITAELCSPDGGPVQELARHLRRPIDVFIPQVCDDDSKWNPVGRGLIMASNGADRDEVFFHELMHAVFWQNGGSEQTGQWVSCLFREIASGRGFHDETVFDPDDGSLMLSMDSRTSPFAALSEGLSNAVAMAYAGLHHSNRMQRMTRAFRLEARARGRDRRGRTYVLWRQKSWEQQQANEWFVTAVLHDYLTAGGGTREIIRPRLARLVAALRRARPTDLEGLLRRLMDPDPTELDRILGRLNANWDSNRDELRRLRER